MMFVQNVKDTKHYCIKIPLSGPNLETLVPFSDLSNIHIIKTACARVISFQEEGGVKKI